jgi:cation transport ATPase
MLDMRNRYAQASRTNQRINRALSQENASAATFHQSVRAQAFEQDQSLRVTKTSSVLAVSTAWISFTFMLCYLALPLLRTGLGLSSQSMVGILATTLTSAAALVVVVPLLWSALVRRRSSMAVNVNPDHILAATSGSLLVWGLLHSILPGLVTFDMMGLAELTTFVGANIIESSMFGVLFASLAKNGRHAFSMGALFQTLFLGLSYLSLFTLF